MTIALPGRPVMEIVKEESRRFCVGVDEILGERRHKRIALARQVAIWRARKELGLSWPVLGREFSRDHTTAIHAVQKIEAIIAKATKGGANEKIRQATNDQVSQSYDGGVQTGICTAP